MIYPLWSLIFCAEISSVPPLYRIKIKSLCKISMYIASSMRYTAPARMCEACFPTYEEQASPVACKLKTNKYIDYMKKTLITILALAGSASAALTLDATLSTSSSYSWDTDVNGAAITLILSKDAMKALDGNTMRWNQVFASFELTDGSYTVTSGTGDESTTTTTPLDRISIECTTYTTNAIRATNSQVPTTYGTSPRWDFFGSQYYANKTAWDTATCAALTFGVNSTGSLRAVLSVINADGTITNITQATASNKISFDGISQVNLNSTHVTDAFVYSGTWGNTDLTTITNNALKTANIPEPATATLSLLALAGLAARRRRK